MVSVHCVERVDVLHGPMCTSQAITIGVSADRNVKYALENIGSKTPREEDFHVQLPRQTQTTK
eukprot:5041059-Amphidinium_carterae.1